MYFPWLALINGSCNFYLLIQPLHLHVLATCYLCGIQTHTSSDLANGSGCHYIAVTPVNGEKSVFFFLFYWLVHSCSTENAHGYTYLGRLSNSAVFLYI